MSLAELPPIIIALVALSSALLWQIAGTLVLLPLVPRTFPTPWRIAVVWLAWLPISGGAALALVLLNLATRPLLLALAAVVGLVATLRLKQARSWLVTVHEAWRETRRTAQPYERWLFHIGLALHVMALVFAAHPQRLYDQLNYHLVVGHLVWRDGQPFTGALDPHVWFAGIVDYAFVWHHTWCNSMLLFNASAQIAVMLATIPVVLWCAGRLGRFSLGWLGVLLALLPGVVPESTVFRMAKPDGLAFSGVVLLLSLLVAAPSGWPLLALALGLMLLAAKLTFGHALLALGIAYLVVRPSFGRVRALLPLLLIGICCVSLHVWKNQAYLGNPVYPTGGTIFPSFASDTTTESYWHKVAYGDETRWTGWLGPLRLARRATGLYVCATIAAVLLWLRRKRERTADSTDSHMPLTGVLAFMLAYWVLWPAFYGGHVATTFSRFVNPFAAGVLVLFVQLQSRLQNTDRRMLHVACLCIGLTTSHLDRTLPGLWRWTAMSARNAYAQQWPRLETALALNPHLATDDIVLADKPAKLYFNALLLFTEPLSPREREMVIGLQQQPQVTASRLHLKAIIAAANAPMPAHLETIWKSLEPYGRVLQLGEDRVLFSACYFQSACDTNSDLQFPQARSPTLPHL